MKEKNRMRRAPRGGGELGLSFSFVQSRRPRSRRQNASSLNEEIEKKTHFSLSFLLHVERVSKVSCDDHTPDEQSHGAEEAL